MILNFGVADFGYDFYLLAIAKLLHGQYFRLLDFYFHTLIQQRLYFCFTQRRRDAEKRTQRKNFAELLAAACAIAFLKDV
jgi:hypothetical protein